MTCDQEQRPEAGEKTGFQWTKSRVTGQGEARQRALSTKDRKGEPGILTHKRMCPPKSRRELEVTVCFGMVEEREKDRNTPEPRETV